MRTLNISPGWDRFLPQWEGAVKPPMRVVYTDEAGISANEPVSVVAAVVIDPDTQYFPICREIARLKELVPERFRQGFEFHAKTISGGKGRYADWDDTRFDLLAQLMQVISKYRLLISVSAIWRGRGVAHIPGGTIDENDHYTAFARSMGDVDEYMRLALPGQVALVVAENVDKKKARLEKMAELMRGKNPPRTMVMEVKPNGDARYRQEWMEIKKLIHELHFSTRELAPILQLADVLAFGFRRYFAGQSHGEWYVRHILGVQADTVIPDVKSGIAPKNGYSLVLQTGMRMTESNVMRI